MIQRRNVASQTEVLDNNVFEFPPTVTELQDMETQTTNVENESVLNMMSSEAGESEPTTSSLRQNVLENRKQPWKIRYGRRRTTTFSLDAVRLNHDDMYDIRKNPTKFAKIFGPSVGNPGVHTAYIKVRIFNIFLKIIRVK